MVEEIARLGLLATCLIAVYVNIRLVGQAWSMYECLRYSSMLMRRAELGLAGVTAGALAFFPPAAYSALYRRPTRRSHRRRIATRRVVSSFPASRSREAARRRAWALRIESFRS